MNIISQIIKQNSKKHNWKYFFFTGHDSIVMTLDKYKKLEENKPYKLERIKRGEFLMSETGETFNSKFFISLKEHRKRKLQKIEYEL
jgi:hypothetical protein